MRRHKFKKTNFIKVFVRFVVQFYLKTKRLSVFFMLLVFQQVFDKSKYLIF